MLSGTPGTLQSGSWIVAVSVCIWCIRHLCRMQCKWRQQWWPALSSFEQVATLLASSEAAGVVIHCLTCLPLVPLLVSRGSVLVTCYLACYFWFSLMRRCWCLCSSPFLDKLMSCDDTICCGLCTTTTLSCHAFWVASLHPLVALAYTVRHALPSCLHSSLFADCFLFLAWRYFFLGF